MLLITEMEHHADVVPWQLLAEEKGIEIRVVPIDTDRDVLDMEIFESLFAGFSIGLCRPYLKRPWGGNPVADIISQSHAAGAKVLIDAAQAASRENQLRQDGCRFCGHQWTQDVWTHRNWLPIGRFRYC